MPDSVRMMDLAAHADALKDFRRLDPEHRLWAHRMAGQAAAQRLEDDHRDVADAERSAASREQARPNEDGRREGGRREGDPEGAETASPRQAVPEQDEGHVLDIEV